MPEFNPTFEPSLAIENFKKLTGKEITREGAERLGRLINIVGPRYFEEYQQILLPLESYLMEFISAFQSINAKADHYASLIEKLTAQTQELISTRAMIEDVQKVTATADSFASSVEKIQESAKKIEEHFNDAGSSVNAIQEITIEARERGDKLAATLKVLPEKLEAELSKRTSEVVERIVNEKQKRFFWTKTTALTSFFLLSFGFFGAIFFIVGILALKGGLPPWIIQPSHDDTMFLFSARVIFGLPLSWLVFIGGALVSAVWIFEAYKKEAELRLWEFICSHKIALLSIVLGITTIYWLCVWFI